MNQKQRAVWEKVVELLEDNREYIEADERIEYLLNYDEAIAEANALLEQPVQVCPHGSDSACKECHEAAQPAPTHGPYSAPIKHLWPVAQPEPDMYWDDDDSERPASDSIPELLYERWNNGDLEVGYEVSMTCAKQMEPLTVRVTKIDEDADDIEYEVVKKGTP